MTTLSACETSERKMKQGWKREQKQVSSLLIDDVKDAQKFASALCQCHSRTKLYTVQREHACELKAPTQMWHNSAQMGHEEVNVVQNCTKGVATE